MNQPVQHTITSSITNSNRTLQPISPAALLPATEPLTLTSRKRRLSHLYKESDTLGSVCEPMRKACKRSQSPELTLGTPAVSTTSVSSDMTIDSDMRSSQNPTFEAYKRLWLNLDVEHNPTDAKLEPFIWKKMKELAPSSSNGNH